MPRRIVALLLAVGLLGLGAGCGLNMQRNYQKMRPKLVQQDYASADAYVDSVKTSFYDKDNRLLYYLDKGMVLYLGKKHRESNDYLEKAKRTAEELWTESVTKNIEAWLTTDNSLPYQGEDFEKVLIHFVAALNYLALDDFDAARVEARQITNKLELYNSKYEGKKNAYRDDAFARWLAGKLAETDGGLQALNDAWIDYKKALAIYERDYAKHYGTPVPSFVIADALRVLHGLGEDFAPELEELRARYPSVSFTTEEQAQELAEIVLVHLSGEAPYKVDRFWTARAGASIIRIAYPVFVPKHARIVGARVSVAGRTAAAGTEVAENITAIAVKNLDDHMGRIMTKTIARQVSKYLAAKGMQAGGRTLARKRGKGNAAAGTAIALAGAAFEIGSAIAEEADKRSWITLPAAVNVARLWTEPGSVQLEIAFVDRGGRVVDTRVIPVEAEAGKTTFVSYRTFR